MNAISPPQRYILDMTNKKAHLSSCPLILPDSEIKGMGTLENVIRHLFPPCECCSEEYWAFSWKRAEENIRKIRLNFVFEEGTGLFHTPSCEHVRKIPFPQIHGSYRYENALWKGYHPCDLCKPGPEDEKKLPRILNEKKSAAVLANTPRRRKPESVALQYTLNRLAVNAVKRFEQASRERADLPVQPDENRNRDARILSDSRYVFWAAEGYLSFHRRGCPKMNGLTHLRGFGCFADAVRSGLTPCKLCKPSPKEDIPAAILPRQRVRPDETEKQINAFCDSIGWKHEIRTDAYYVETPFAKWKLRTDTFPMQVYHMPHGSNHYHRQNLIFLSMTDTMRYIAGHDRPRKSQEQKICCFEQMIRDAKMSYYQKAKIRQWPNSENFELEYFG